jgi:ABC-type Co2+ transport system permease subunit
VVPDPDRRRDEGKSRGAQGDERARCPWSLFLRLLVSLFFFLLAMSFITPWNGGDERWIPWAVAAVGILVLAQMTWVRRRPLVTGSLESLAGSYRANFFLGVGVAESAALFGLVGVFIGGSLWIYLVGLAFALVGFLDDRPDPAGHRAKTA